MAGLLDLTTFRAAVVEALGNRTDLTVAQEDRWINQAYNHISRPNVHRHRELMATQSITVLASTRSYTLATDFRGIRSVFDSTDQYKINPEATWKQDARRLTTSSRFSNYILEGVNIIFSQTPNTELVGNVITVRYWQRPIALSAGGDFTAISPDWDDVITAGAIYRGWRALNETERMREARDEYARLIREVQDELRLSLQEDPFTSTEPWIQVYTELP